MARPKFVELLYSGEGMPSHPLCEYIIVSDYRDEKGRHLFLKREETAAAPRKERKKKEKLSPAKTQVGFTEEDLK